MLFEIKTKPAINVTNDRSD